ncbi:MAG: glycoside hydrolase family 3 N-terminal domain-containing protein [Opitutus sp.]
MNPFPRSIAALVLVALVCSPSAFCADAPPAIVAQAKPVLTVDGLRFKDANANGKLDPYEDWRRATDDRVADLVAQMTLEEKAGMMLIDTLNAAVGGVAPENASAFVQNQQMRRFIFRNVVTAKPDGQPPRGPFAGAQVSPRQAAEFTNAIQKMAEATRLGIPVVFKSNARNHYERQARGGINEAAGAMSTWPKEAGLAATRDQKIVRSFAHAMGTEWQAIGLRGAYAYMADLATEPRWFRVHETFTEDADLATEIIRTLVKELQGGPVNPRTKVALTMKHFPGGGPQELGLDPHYTFGKNQVYPANRFADHLKPFRAAINGGVSSIMPYYGVPIHLSYDGVTYDSTGMAFSHQLVTDLLRGKLKFNGYVNSDTGIIEARAWGLENKSVPERVAAAINAGSDVLSGFHDKDPIVALVNDGLVSAKRIDEAVGRLLHEQFALGLFENPYVDASAADGIVGQAEFRTQALDAQRKSIVLLSNSARVLPLRAPKTAAAVKLYTLGLDAAVVGSSTYGGFSVTVGDSDAKTRAPVPAGTDYAVIRVEVSNPRELTGSYRSSDAATGGTINSATGKAWGAEDPKGLDDRLNFGGAFPWEVGMISFSTMAKAKSWRIEPSLDDIQNVMKEIGDPKKVILCIYFRQPYVLDEASGLLQAGALVATFGVGDEALMDVLTGSAKPHGKLPFALARTLAAVEANDPDAPGYPKKDTLFPFGFGLSY